MTKCVSAMEGRPGDYAACVYTGKMSIVIKRQERQNVLHGAMLAVNSKIEKRWSDRRGRSQFFSERSTF